MRIALLSMFLMSSSFATSEQYLFENIVEFIKRDYDMLCTQKKSKKYYCSSKSSTLLGFEISVSKPFFLFRFLSKGKYFINFKYNENSESELFRLDPANDKSAQHNQPSLIKSFFGRQLSLDTLQLLSDKKTADCTEFVRKLNNYSGPGDEEYTVDTMSDMHYQGSNCLESNGNEIKFRVMYDQNVIKKIQIKE